MNHPAKRVFDLFFASISLLFFSPLMALCALLIKLESPGAVLYAQERVGKDGKPFKLFKFRTMAASAPGPRVALSKEEVEGFVFPPPPEENFTRIGRWIYRSGVNELPQLFNVLRGEMSMVGPRPEIRPVVDQYPEEYRLRLTVKPGLTSKALIDGKRIYNLRETVENDLDYIRHWSLGLDFWILVQTLLVPFYRHE